ncbi:IclR family transcriptional regulator [Candidatus Bipolaricaulota bacterium]
MKTLDRGFELLEYIVEAGQPVPASDLMKLTGLDRSTIYRYLGVLLERRYVQTDPERRGYTSGCRVLELSGSILAGLNVRDVARPLLLKLSNTLSLTAHLAIRDAGHILYIDKVETQRSLPIISRIGSQAPLYCTSLGKALLAYEEPGVVEELLSTQNLLKRTENTITNLTSLQAELETVRATGFAVDNEENELGVYCMACPIFDVTETVCAAISVTGLKRQFDQPEQIAEVLSEASREISACLGAPSESEFRSV